MKSMTMFCLLRGFVGSGGQEKRQPQAIVKLVIQGWWVMLRTSGILVSRWLWVKQAV